MKGRINSLLSQVDELTWLNGINEQKEAAIQEKLNKKKEKQKAEKNRLKKEFEDMKIVYETYIESMQCLWQRDHAQFAE